jgi:hypothetical protein
MHDQSGRASDGMKTSRLAGGALGFELGSFWLEHENSSSVNATGRSVDPFPQGGRFSPHQTEMPHNLCELSQKTDTHRLQRGGS